MTTKRTSMTKHIMLSYQRNSSNIVLKVYDYLTKNQSIPIWMDVYGGTIEYLTTSLAEGVENCCLIICFLTPEYQASVYCKKELTYASELQKPIISCLLGSNDKTTKWKPSQWLGLTIADLLYLNFTKVNDDNFDEKCQELLDKIQLILGNNCLSSPPPSSSSQQQSDIIVKEESDDDEFETTSSSILPSIIHEGPQINDDIPTVTPQIHSNEGDSFIHLINQSSEIECNQDLYARNGQFFNSFTLSRLIFHNTNTEHAISILKLSAEYEQISSEDGSKEWKSCQIKQNNNDEIINLDPNKLFLCSLTIQIQITGTPGIDNQHRLRAHPLLPQPLRIRIQIEDTQMKHSNLLIEQINQPLNLPTLEKLIDKLHLSSSTILGFVSTDDCSIEIRYFVLIYSINDDEKNSFIKFTFGCDLSCFRSPTWDKQFIKTLQKRAKKEHRFELIVHEDIFDSFIHCLALFNENFKLHAIRITIKTKTSQTIQIIPLPIQQIFAEYDIF
ncbi:hypothetical protein I4U23_017354 [Adineta vaga]|nr:hypothetical protein I4U23_017354 [Adineta vaga]